MSSYRDIEESLTQVQLYFPEAAKIGEAKRRLGDALAIVGAEAKVESAEIPDEDWKLSYRRHFKTEAIGERLVVRPPWEGEVNDGRVVITLDPGLAFGTGKHETTRACLEFIEAESPREGEGAKTFLDMGSGSGILSIAAAKLGYADVCGFDVDDEAVASSRENAAANSASVSYVKFALGRRRGSQAASPAPADLVAANILGPLLIRFADEIAPLAPRRLIVSGILSELYADVLAAYVSRGYREVARKTYGEWTTGLLEKS